MRPNTARHETELRRAAAELRDAEEKLVTAQGAAKTAVGNAREAGLTWAQIEELTGLPDRRLRWLFERERPYVAEAKERMRQERAQTPTERRATRPGRGPGIGVAEASRVLGKSRTWIYKMIDSGQLKVTQNDAGVTRIIGGEGLEHLELGS